MFDLPLGPDISEYYDWAMKIRAGSFLWDELNIHSPCYPFFLAALLEICSDNFFLVRFVQSLFFLISGLALFYFLFIYNSDFCESRKGFIASFIFSIYPPLIYLSSEFYSEALLIPLLCWAIIFENFALNAKSSKNRLFFSGIFAFFSALSLLTHPLSILFLLINFFYFFYLLRKKCIKIALQNGAIFSVVFVIILAPVSLYNGIHFKKFFPFQGNSGFNFYLGNNPYANGTCMIRPGPEWERIHQKAKFITEKNELSTDAYFILESFNFILKKPLHYIALLLKKTFLVWNKTELISGADLTDFRYYTPFQKYTSWSFAVLGVIALTALISFFFVGINFKRTEKVLLLLFFSFWIAQIITVTSSRYRSPMLLAEMSFISIYISDIY
ncbi:MAG TPA: glycosyltransferase family 39 protein, partial [Victivallales bacterium]|nr:glycosyltransferase family 39 protein [Victivallales bacterium]